MSVEVGQQLVSTRVFEQNDFDRFARLTGDNNPIHVDPTFAAQTRFKKTLCHGMLLFSTLSSAISHVMMGSAVMIVDVELMFPGPTYTGDSMTIRVEVLSVSAAGDRAEVSAMIAGPDGSPSCVGRATVLFPKEVA